MKQKRTYEWDKNGWKYLYLGELAPAGDYVTLRQLDGETTESGLPLYGIYFAPWGKDAERITIKGRDRWTIQSAKRNAENWMRDKWSLESKEV